jgi:ribosomal protein S18 acetylase RimI-like enzyme
VAVVIERLHALHPESIKPLVAESEQAGLTFVRRLAEEWASGRNRFDRPGEAFVAATLDGQIVGVCGLSIDPYTSAPRVGRVRHLYVPVEHRHLGVGRQLVVEIIRVARDSFETLRLRTNNPAAARLYELTGFRRCEGEHDCTHIMDLS